MFSENNRISGRQAFRLLTYDLLGLSTLLVPPALGRLAGRDGIFCIAAGVAAGLAFLKLLGVLAQDMEESYPAYLRRRLGAFGGALAQAGYLIYFLLLAGYTAYLFTDVVRKNLLREESFYLVLLILVLLAVYGMWGGIEGRARIYEMLFWFLIVPLFLMLFFALDEIRTDYWIPVVTTGLSGFLAGSYGVFVCMALIVFVVFAGGYVENKRTLMRAGKSALLFTGGIHAALYLILLGIFGAAALGKMDYPAVTLMSAVRISGGFLKRADSFMFAVWFFTLYALLSSCVFYASALLLQLCGRGRSGERAAAVEGGAQGQEPGKGAGAAAEGSTQCRGPGKGAAVEGGAQGQEPGKGAGAAAAEGDARRPDEAGQRQMRIASAVLLAAVFAIASCFYKSGVWIARCEKFLWYIGTPFLVIVPLILWGSIFFSDRRRRKAAVRGAGMLAALLFCAGCLAGCGTAELEDRNFPIELAVKDTEHVALAWMNAGQEGNREIDYSHLKVIVFGREFIENETAMQEFLDLLEETDEVPRNTYLVVADDPEEVLGTEDAPGEGVDESVGNYLEQLFENVSQIRKQAYPTLGMLYQERANRCETLFLPYVSMEEGRPVVTQYYAWRRGEPAGVVENQAALLAYFTGNDTKEYTLALENGAVILLTGAHNQISFGEEDGRRRVLVDIRCDGELRNGRGQEESAGDRAEQYMQELAQTALKERRIDVTGSYRKLGGIRRDWYAEYAQHPETYETDMEIVYRVQIDWVNQ